ncbi:MAG: hypothetical protein HWN51_03180, partial [Desulfobacterales bacterium]|nr:hypothetical protein [Desulfobacterales bacterium]
MEMSKTAKFRLVYRANQGSGKGSVEVSEIVNDADSAQEAFQIGVGKAAQEEWELRRVEE